MKRIISILLTVLMVMNSVFTVNVVMADEDPVIESEQIEYVDDVTDEGSETADGAIVPAAEETDDTTELHSAAAEVWRPDDPKNDNEELLKGYINSLLYGELVEMDKEPVNLFEDYEINSKKRTGDKLEGANAVLYHDLMAAIDEIAKGNRESSVISVNASRLKLSKTSWTAEELGLESITQQDLKKVYEIIGFDFNQLFQALLFDNPYSFYWFDKTSGVSYSTPLRYNSSMVRIEGDFSFNFDVSDGYKGAQDYTVSSALIGKANQAIDKAQSIVEQYSGSSDIDKLKGYKNEICDLVSYNTEAASGSVSYGNPWQLIWVFDEDASTNVVCEGYSKAFQYLCDLTDFANDEICTYSVTGGMDGGTGAGAHMWNIVHMDDHKNYIADVTNCDDGSIGYPEGLFLVNTGTGSAESGYVFSLSGGDISYTYDDETKAAFSQDELTLNEEQKIDQAYAILTNGDLIFFRSYESYINGNTYDVTINGTSYSGVVFSGFEDVEFTDDRLAPWNSYASQVISVSVPETAKIHPVSLYKWFNNFSNMTSADLKGLDTSKVANFAYMFSACDSITSLDLSGFDTSNAVKMNSMFLRTSKLQSLDLTGFDTSNVVDMMSMFNVCGARSVPGLDAFDTSKVTNMDGMFSMSSIRNIDLSGWDTSKVTNMAYMFESSMASSLDLSSFDTSNVVDMSSMFEYSSAEQINISGFNTSNVSRMTKMFENSKVRKITLGQNFKNWIDDAYLPEGKWEHNGLKKTEQELYEQYPSNAASWAGEWELSEDTYAYAVLTSEGELIFFRSNVLYSNGTEASVTDINGNPYQGIVYAIAEDENYESVPWNDVRDQIVTVRAAEGQTVCPYKTEQWFDSCENLASFNATGFDTGRTVDMSDMFSYCKALTSLDLSGLDTSNVTDMSGMFAGDSALESINLSNFETNSVTNMANMFYGCSKLQSLDLSSFDTRNVLSFQGMFNGCSALKQLDINHFRPGSATSIGSMFADCRSLNALDLSDWDTSSVKDMNGVFSGCFGLNTLDLSSWDTSAATGMARMFNGCNNLTALDVSHFDTLNVTNMSLMFGMCGVKELDLSDWDTTNVENMASLFEGAGVEKITLGIYFKNWSENARLPEGTWSNGELSLTEAELQTGYAENAEAWAGTWTLAQETGPQDLTHVIQDSETLDIVITSDDANWLIELKASLDQDKYISFDNGEAIFEDTCNYYVFEYEGDVLSSIRIAHEALLAKHVRSNAAMINFPATESYEGFDLDISALNIEACKKTPEGLKVKETDEGIILYFDQVGEEELAYYNGILEPLMRNDQNGEILKEGGSVSIYEQNGDHGLYDICNRKAYDPGDDSYTLISKLYLSEDSSYICIPVDVILNESSLVITDDTVNVVAYAYGYTYGEALTLDGLKHASKPLSEDFSVSVSMDEDFNIYIRSNDEEWLEALCRQRIYDSSSVSENGSSLVLFNDERDIWVTFQNSSYSNSSIPETQYELRTDEQTDEKYIYLSKESLSIRFADYRVTISEPETLYFEFRAYGYEQYRTDAQTQNGSVVFETDINADAPIDYIYENENGDIVISSSQSEAFASYTEAFRNDYRNYIYVTDNSSNHTNVFQYLYRDSGHSDELRFEDGKIIIPNNVLLNRNMENAVYEVEIKVNGYHRFSRTLELTKACAEAPTDVSVSIDEDKNLVITSDSADWLNNLSEGYIEFGLNGSYKSLDGGKITFEEGRAVVSSQNLSSLSLKDGNYRLYLVSRGFGRIEKKLTLSGYAKTLTAQITVSGETGELIVTCDDSDYLNALTENRIYNVENGEYKEVSAGGYISFTFPDNTYAQIDNFIQNNLDYNDSYEESRIVIEGNKAVISNTTLMSDESIYDSDGIKVLLHAPGYADLSFNDVTITNTRKNFVPQQLTITAEENGDLTIACENKEWLRALCTPSVYSVGTYTRGGSIVLEDPEEHSYRTFTNNTYGVQLMSYDED